MGLNKKTKVFHRNSQVAAFIVGLHKIYKVCVDKNRFKYNSWLS